LEGDKVNAMTVSTIGLDGFPKARVVLLKNFDEEGLFFTPIIIQKG
jgi:pyridoxamine 5'-phosphate oxidase